jgi:hypothetical protein
MAFVARRLTMDFPENREITDFIAARGAKN